MEPEEKHTLHTEEKKQFDDRFVGNNADQKTVG